MHPEDRLPILSLFLIIGSFTLIHIPKTFGQDQEFVTCGEPFQCGNINFTYPFWGGNRPETCGYPGFNLTCQGVVPLFTVDPVTYRILRLVDTPAQTLTVARDDLWSNNCPQHLHNTTLNFKIFSYSQDTDNITLYYNCTGDTSNNSQQPIQSSCTANTTSSFAPSPAPASKTSQVSCTVYAPPVTVYSRGSVNPNKFACAANSFSFFATSAASGAQNTSQFSCTDIITVPVNQAAARSLVNTSALRLALTGGFNLTYEANNTRCTECTQSGGRCGYNTRFNSFACYCNDRVYDLVCNGRNRGRTNLVKGLLISIAAAGTILAVCIIYCLAKRRSPWKALMCWKLDDGNNQQVEAFMRNYGSISPKLYTYSEIKRITNSFAYKLGHGGYGSVYKGKLFDGRQVAVKVLNDSKGNGEDFINEVSSISRTSHVNVVTLLGFCYNGNKRALIYEFMPNGSLDRFICQKRTSQDTTTGCQLEFKILYEIAVGIARGLEYLHRGCNTRIVHFDIKPHNILLDKDFCPKISDFGMAKLCERKQSNLSVDGARGTVGYIAPEVFCRNFGAVSHKSDVYSYGMMLLDIVGLRKKIGSGTGQTSEKYFPDWIYEHLELEKKLEIQDATNEEEEVNSRKMILVGLWCIQTNPADRPSMSKVVEMLEGSLEHLQIPPKPFVGSSPVARKSTEETGTSSIS